MDAEGILVCGHSPNAIQTMSNGDKIPACAICDCNEFAETPSLDGRMARCFHYGSPAVKLRDMGGCDTRANRQSPCLCEVPSTFKLWFFEYKADGDFDEYYCGCHGYD